MRLKSLKLQNFRNYEEASLELYPGINIFIGDNGSGKTNILEAIYILSLTKSCRYGSDMDLIQLGSSKFSISGEVFYDDYQKQYQVVVDKYQKRVFINLNQVKKISEYISNFCVTSFLPNDLNIIKGAPSDRRNLLNIQIGQVFNNYLNHVNEYNRILKMRNDYLKRMNINAFSDSKFLDVINQKMVNISLKIYYYRYFYIEEINKVIANIFKKLSGISELKISYVNNLGLDFYDENAIRDSILDKWQKNITKEMFQGMTLFGLHRDDLIFLINNQDARIFASQGQQRLIVIAYKIAELQVFKKIKKDYPVLLLDDVFSEIDIKKRNQIIKYLKSDIQVIITTTDIEEIQEDLVNSAKIFKIKNGTIKNKGGGINARRKSNGEL